MKVLLTGATGLIGSWVARELLAAGHEVRALVRKTSNLANLAALPIERAEGDALDGPSVRRALEGCGGVIHTAGIAHFRPGDAERMYAVNVGSVETVLGAALEARVDRAVYTSSTGAMGGSRTPRVNDESAPSNAEDLGIDYLITKHRGERTAMGLARCGLPVCAVRPVVALGPGDIYNSSGTTVLGIARGQFPVYVEGGSSFCDVRDVAKAHVAALERGRPGEAYILGGHNMDIGTMVSKIAKIAGVRPPRRAPYAIAYAVAAVVELFGRATGRPADLSRQLVRASHLYTYVSSAKAEKELGYTIRPFEDSVRDTLVFFIQEGRLKPNTPELERIAAACLS